MKAAVWYGRKDIRILDMPRPDVPVGHVLVKVAWAGICGTDRHEYTGPNFIPVTKPHRLTGRTAPLIIGHEFAGTIAAVADDVTGWQTGERVTANGTLSCGVCAACRSGRYNICEKLGFVGVSRDGAFAEYVSIEAARLFRVPDSLSLRHAVLAEPLACGLHATGLLGDIAGKTVVVVGPGIIGLSCFFAAREAGAGKIVVAGLGSTRQEFVEKAGGGNAFYVDTAREELAAAVRARAGGLAAIAYECVGHPAALASALAALQPSGALMVMGVYEKPPLFPMNDFQEGERRLYTSQAHLDEIARALPLLANGTVDAESLITAEVTLDTLVPNGFEELLAHGEEHIKICIRIGGEE